MVRGSTGASNVKNSVTGESRYNIAEARFMSTSRPPTCENSNMAGRGGFRRGAGRKSKASKLIEAGFVANWFTVELQEIKVEITGRIG